MKNDNKIINLKFRLQKYTNGDWVNYNYFMSSRTKLYNNNKIGVLTFDYLRKNLEEHAPPPFTPQIYIFPSFASAHTIMYYVAPGNHIKRNIAPNLLHRIQFK